MRSFYLSRDSYVRGFEDACELILYRISKLKNRNSESIEGEIRYILSLVKEGKYSALMEMLQQL
ncbi:MAG: hypothetical protein ACXQTI_00700 [Candidatus Nezhaarchaeales archaeon]